MLACIIRIAFTPTGIDVHSGNTSRNSVSTHVRMLRMRIGRVKNKRLRLVRYSFVMLANCRCITKDRSLCIVSHSADSEAVSNSLRRLGLTYSSYM